MQGNIWLQRLCFLASLHLCIVARPRGLVRDKTLQSSPPRSATITTADFLKFNVVFSGVCAAVRSTVGMSNDPLYAAIDEAVAFNATSAALLAVAPPFLEESLHSFLMDTGMGGVSPSAKLIAFFSRLASLQLLPGHVVARLGLAYACLVCYMWSFLGLGAAFFWRARFYGRIAGVVLKVLNKVEAQQGTGDEGASAVGESTDSTPSAGEVGTGVGVAAATASEAATTSEGAPLP